MNLVNYNLIVIKLKVICKMKNKVLSEREKLFVDVEKLNEKLNLNLIPFENSNENIKKYIARNTDHWDGLILNDYQIKLNFVIDIFQNTIQLIKNISENESFFIENYEKINTKINSINKTYASLKNNKFEEFMHNN